MYLAFGVVWLVVVSGGDIIRVAVKGVDYIASIIERSRDKYLQPTLRQIVIKVTHC